MTLSQWADKFRRLSAGSSAEPGRWKTAKAPYQKEIMDAITDITIKKVVIMSAAQVGKTDAMVLNPIGYYVHYDPSPIMVIQPTIDMAEKFSKEKLSPMLRDTPVLADRINEKSRNSGNTIMQKIFPGGFITIAGANSPTGLRSHTIRILLADEIDAYPASAGKEGDPLLLASKRQTTFWNKKQVDISTPTVKGASRIEVEYENSSRGEWNTPCPCCGELQPLVWSNVIFDKEDLTEIRYACSKCGVISSEAEWKEHFVDGTFVHEDPENPVRGFHLNTLASTLTTWQEVMQRIKPENVTVFPEKQAAEIVGRDGVYDVTLNSCTCHDFEARQLPCKHIYKLASELGYLEDLPKPSRKAAKAFKETARRTAIFP